MTRGDNAAPTGREVRTQGVDVRVEIMRYRKLRLSSDAGRVYEFMLIVKPPNGANFLLEVGNPVPTDAVGLVVPGQELPAKLLERDRRALLIDWEAALAAATDRLAEAPSPPSEAGDPEGSTALP
jgi:hypothetical protein